ncbi:protein of unknown function [Pseudodesulfovibrio profundus]|uniref:Solute-binding protein family 3/N-terminal domain-containing protein n=2 Tax=Pseudodesulfovibrio profundus TaxID=57320 RepID=A0A2C8FC16_9BACT|nr:protein of unknown function [Pseudodesulfovibrio profundus]
MIKYFIPLIVCIMIFALPLTVKAESVQKNGLIIAQSEANPPFSYLDESGEPQGYIIDLWRAYSNITGTPVTFKLTTLPQSITLVKTGEADVHGGLFPTPDQDRFLEYGQVVTTIASAIFIHGDLENSAIEDFPVAVVTGSHAETVMRESSPDRYLLHFENMQNILEAASKGLVKVIAGSTPNVLYYLRERGLDTQFIKQETLSVDELHIAVAKGNAQQLAEIAKGWSQIDKSLRKHIHDVWFIKDTPMPSWVPPVTVTTFFILILGLLLRRFLR